MNFNFEQEWEFITVEIHSEKPRETNLIKREILLALQVLLSGMEKKNYFTLKKIYCEAEPKQKS